MLKSFLLMGICSNNRIGLTVLLFSRLIIRIAFTIVGLLVFPPKISYKIISILFS